MPRLGIDCETSGPDLRAVGADRYAKDPSTRVLLWAVRVPEWPRALVFEKRSLERVLGELRRSKQLAWSAADPLEIVHWGPFDRLIVEHTEGWGAGEWALAAGGEAGWRGPMATRWIDLAAFSRTFGAPGNLAEAAAFWAGQKKDAGKALIHRFSKADPEGEVASPEEDWLRWERFKSYAGQDVDVMMAVYDAIVALEGRHTLADHWPAMAMVERMNRRGVPIDRAAAAAAIEALEREEAERVARCTAVWGFKPSQTERVREALGLPDVRKQTLKAALPSLSGPERELALIRLETAGAARKKLVPMLRRSTPEDPRVRDAFVYHGAWTRRMSSIGLQVQNFVRGKTDEGYFEALAEGAPEDLFEGTRSNIRGFIAPQKGTLVAADYSAVELRVGAWLARQHDLVAMLAAGVSPYKQMAELILGLPEGTVQKGTPEYDFGKMVELACIYQLSGHGLQKRAALGGVELSEHAAISAVATYRARRAGIVRAWEECHGCFAELIDAPLGSWRSVLGGRCRLERWPLHIKAVRPSGFAQYFFLPQWIMGHWPSGEPRPELGYVGRGEKGGGMVLQTTYGGNVYQGLVQGTAADLLYAGMAGAERAGFVPIMSVHDEVVCELPETERSWVGDLVEAILPKLPWAEGLPLEAEGWQGPRFTK